MFVKESQSKKEKDICNYDDMMLCEEYYSESYSYDEMSSEDFNSCFLLLQNPENWTQQKIISKICKCVRHEKPSKEQFELLLIMATTLKKGPIVNEILEIFELLSSKSDSQCFLSIVPQNFLQRISIFLPSNSIFSIYRNCLSIDPDNAIVILVQMNIIEIILKNLNKIYSIKLFAELQKYKITFPICEKIVPHVLSQTIMYFNEKKNEDYIKALKKVIKNKITYVQMVVQDPNFISIFAHKKYQHKQRIALIKFINSLCKPDKRMALLFATSQIFQFISESLNINNKINSENKKKEFYLEYFQFLYYVGESDEGKRFLFQNNVHLVLFQMIDNAQFYVLNNSIKILCQIGKVDDINILSQLIQNNLIGILSESILSLSVPAQRSAIDCLSNIQRYGETHNIDDLVLIIFENQDIMEAVQEMMESEDQTIADFSNALYLRYKLIY